MVHDFGHRIRFDGVMDVHRARQMLSQELDTLADEPAVIGIERRAADPSREFRKRHAADDEAVVHHWELIHRRVARLVHAVASKSSRNS